MQFNATFLVRLCERTADYVWIATCASAGVQVHGATEQDAFRQVDQALHRFVDTDMAAYITAAGRNDQSQRCPNGRIDHLADRWFCKATRSTCPIDAVLSRVHLEASWLRCNAEDAVKDGVRGALREYTGFHNKSGTYACPECRDRYGYTARAFYYPFELQTLRDVLDLGQQAECDAIRKRCFETASILARYTPDCALAASKPCC